MKIIYRKRLFIIEVGFYNKLLQKCWWW